jgi:hypothetical protein
VSLSGRSHAPLPLDHHSAVRLVVRAPSDASLGRHVKVVETEEVARGLSNDRVYVAGEFRLVRAMLCGARRSVRKSTGVAVERVVEQFGSCLPGAGARSQVIT